VSNLLHTWRMGRRSEKIKGRKEAQNKMKTKIFSLIGKKIVAAVRKGGKDPSSNKVTETIRMLSLSIQWF